jgi:hypothetical protein
MDNSRIFGRSSAAYAFSPAAVLLAAALAAPVSAQRADDAGEDAHTAAGPVACLSHPSIRRTTVLDDRNIVFVTRDEEIYVNQLAKVCTGLRRTSLVNYTIANKRQCAGDQFQVLWQTSPGNYTRALTCRLGAFVPITPTELEDLTAMTEPGERRARRRSTREAVTTEQVELPPPAAAPAAATSTPAE